MSTFVKFIRAFVAVLIASTISAIGTNPVSADGASYSLTPATTTLSNWGQSVTLATDAPDNLQARVFLKASCSDGMRSEFQTVADIKKAFQFNSIRFFSTNAISVCIYDSTDALAVNNGSLTPAASALINIENGDPLTAEATWPGFDINYSSASTPSPNEAPVVVSMTAPVAATSTIPYLTTTQIYFDLPQNINPAIFKTPAFEKDFSQPSYAGNIDTYGTLNSAGQCIIHDVEIFDLDLTQATNATPVFSPIGWSCNLFTFNGSNVGLSIYKSGGQISGVKDVTFTIPSRILLQDSDETTLSYVEVAPYEVLNTVKFETPEIAPNAPQKPTVVAGDSKATVTVAAAISGPEPTSFTVTSNPGGKTCSVIPPANSCDVTGLTNGTSYTFTAVAANSGGTSSPSIQSEAVTPAAPSSSNTSSSPATTPSPSSSSVVQITLGVSVGGVVSGSTTTISAGGLQSTAPYEVVVRSTPKTIGSGSAVAGAVNTTVTMPSGLQAGWHSLTFSSTALNGSSVKEILYFKVSDTGTLISSSSVLPSELAKTGADNFALLYVAPILIFLGLGLILFIRRNATGKFTYF